MVFSPLLEYLFTSFDELGLGDSWIFTILLLVFIFLSQAQFYRPVSFTICLSNSQILQCISIH